MNHTALGARAVDPGSNAHLFQCLADQAPELLTDDEVPAFRGRLVRGFPCGLDTFLERSKALDLVCESLVRLFVAGHRFHRSGISESSYMPPGRRSQRRTLTSEECVSATARTDAMSISSAGRLVLPETTQNFIVSPTPGFAGRFPRARGPCPCAPTRGRVPCRPRKAERTERRGWSTASAAARRCRARSPGASWPMPSTARVRARPTPPTPGSWVMP